jgi:endonuclease YncB( thermonuclease family)
MYQLKRYLLSLCLALVFQCANASVFQGLTIAIKDGDTIVVLTNDKQQVTVRLDSIDAPEKKQDYGNAAKKALSGLVYKKWVKVDSHKTDRYGRAVGEVWLEGRLINLEMVESGMAWVYRKYAKDPAYYAAEEKAKAAKLGLWALSNPKAPWEFRHPTITALPATAKMPMLLTVANTEPGVNAGFTCGTKRYCKQMTSREEANFYLNQCGLTRLDRDGDGQACESLN